MSYRTIIVDDQEHQYSIGRTHVKFRGGKAVSKAEIGWPDGDRYMVTPATISEYLRTGKVDQGPQRCSGRDWDGNRCTSTVARLRAWPYAAEIEGKLHYAFICDECAERNAEDI